MFGGILFFAVRRSAFHVASRRIAYAGTHSDTCRLAVGLFAGFQPAAAAGVTATPRRVGTASGSEWAVVRLSEIPPVKQLYDRLAEVLPPGCVLQRVLVLPPRTKPHPRKVVYEIEVDGPHAELIAPRIRPLLDSEELVVERTYGPNKPSRMVDIRPLIETVTLDGHTLTMQLVFVDQSTARPVEVLTALSLPAETYHHRVRQVEVEWDIALAESPPGHSGMERNNVGQEENSHAQT